MLKVNQVLDISLSSDTVDIQLKDSLKQEVSTLKDPKEDFKDLFATTTTSNGINITQLQSACDQLC